MADVPVSLSTPPQLSGGDVVREQDKIMLVLAYLGLLALIPLLTVKDSEYVKWHAKQGLALAACWVAYSILVMIVGVIPVVGWIVSILGCFGHLGVLALTVYAIVKAFQPMRWPIPVVSQIAAKF